MRLLIALAIALAAGCYKPSVTSCQYECNASKECPSGFTCDLDYGRCVGPSGVCGADASVVDATPGPDGPPDAPPVVGIGCFGFADGYQFCPAMPAGDVTLPAMLDTDQYSECSMNADWGPTLAPLQPKACIVSGVNISVPQGLVVSVTGSRPLVLVATDSVTIAGTLDLASHTATGARGGGSENPPCAPGGGPSNFYVGAAGATFRSRGGGGGAAAGGGTAGTSANVGLEPIRLHGGCKGQDGYVNGGSAAPGGKGGGALYIAAKNTLTVSGTINASGAGGGTPDPALGGGGTGGGSGGMIVLWAGTITTQAGAKIFAVGGGGSSGSYSGNTVSPGGEATDPATTAPGGDRGDAGTAGSGGDGSLDVGDGQPGMGSLSGGGGGGGGGGTGLIRASQSLGLAAVAPTPS